MVTKSLKRIDFKHPTGLHGRFVTVRLGEKWAKRLSQGEELEVGEPDGPLLGYAKAVDIWNGDLALVPASIVEMEHEPLCRSYSGLVMGLRMVYQGEPIKPETNVTALILEWIRPAKRLTIL